MSDCIFCKIVAGEIPSYIVYEDENFKGFLDLNPINPGHMLIVPKKHVDHFFDIPKELYTELFLLVKELSPKLKKALSSVRIGITVEGFGVPHAHIHLVPVNAGNELNPERAKPASPEDLEEMRKKISDALKNSA